MITVNSLEGLGAAWNRASLEPGKQRDIAHIGALVKASVNLDGLDVACDEARELRVFGKVKELVQEQSDLLTGRSGIAVYAAKLSVGTCTIAVLNGFYRQPGVGDRRPVRWLGSEWKLQSVEG